MLILKEIYKKYKSNNKNTLKDINISFQEKGLVSILGESGSGKSTLLNLIGGLDKPTSGSIYIDGRDLTGFKRKELDSYHKNYLGFIYQNYNLISYLSVKDNIELLNTNKDLDKLLKKLNIIEYKNKKVNELSGGQMQRVAIARALINSPKILLCDEPTGALDSETSDSIMKLLKKISKDILVIVVTHNDTLANKYSDRIITIKDGSIESDTDSIELYEANNTYYCPKEKVKASRLINIVTKNFINKTMRNLLTIIAFSIGLLSLLAVLSISDGFKKSLDIEEQNTLSKYPIYISANSINVESELNSIFEDTNPTNIENKIYSYSNDHVNTITEDYIKTINSMDSNYQYKIYGYALDNKYVYKVNQNLIDSTKMIAGKTISKNTDVLLMTDNNNKINSNILKSIGLTRDSYSYEELVGKTFKINGKVYKISGIIKGNDDLIEDISGIITTNNITSNIPKEIYLYPKGYEDKKIITNKLLEYEDIYYTDYSTSIKSISNTVMNALKIILIVFSLISLIVSTIMIAIITYISILERIKEIGILKTLGASNRNIKNIFYLQNILIAIFSSLLCIVMIYGISIPFNKFLYELTSLNNIMLLTSKNILYIVGLSILLSIIGSYLPVRKTKRLKIVECLRYE